MARGGCARVLPVCIVVGVALVVAACAGGERPASTEAAAGLRTQLDAGRFDEERAVALLAEAEQAEAAGDAARAMQLYEQAGLLWPDLEEAWRGLGRLAQGPDNQNRRRAAAFMVERVRLYPSDELFVQRDVNAALRLYIEAQQEVEDANPTQVAYAENLAEFYDYRYAERGAYDPPNPYANIQGREIPAAVLSLGGALGYLGALAAGSGGD